MPVFDRIARLAAQHHGTVTRAQLFRLGTTDKEIHTLLTTGVLRRVSPGIYVVAGSPQTWHQELQLAVHRGGPLCLVSHRAASGMWGLDRFRTGHVEVLSPWSRGRTGGGLLHHRSTDLPTRDRARLHGLPVTSPTRTLIDMGRFVGTDRLGRMIDDAVRRDLTSYEELSRRAAELSRPGRDGMAVVHETLRDRPGGAPVPGSSFESDVCSHLVRAGIPEPVRQHRVACDEITYVLDLAWPELLVALECDGFRFHRTPDQLDWDDRRRTELGLRGWLILHVTWRQFRTSPRDVVLDVRRALSQRPG